MFSFENHWKYYIHVSLSYENIPELTLLFKLTTEYWRFFQELEIACFTVMVIIVNFSHNEASKVLVDGG